MGLSPSAGSAENAVVGGCQSSGVTEAGGRGVLLTVEDRFFLGAAILSSKLMVVTLSATTVRMGNEQEAIYQTKIIVSKEVSSS